MEPVPAATANERSANPVVNAAASCSYPPEQWLAVRRRAAETLQDINTQLYVLLRDARQRREASAPAGLDGQQPSLTLPLLLLLELAESVQTLALEYERAAQAARQLTAYECDAVRRALTIFRKTVARQRSPVHLIRAALAAQLGIEPSPHAAKAAREQRWQRIGVARYAKQLTSTLDAFAALLAAEDVVVAGGTDARPGATGISPQSSGCYEIERAIRRARRLLLRLAARG